MRYARARHTRAFVDASATRLLLSAAHVAALTISSIAIYAAIAAVVAIAYALTYAGA